MSYTTEQKVAQQLNYSVIQSTVIVVNWDEHILALPDYAEIAEVDGEEMTLNEFIEFLQRFDAVDEDGCENYANTNDVEFYLLDEGVLEYKVR